MTKTILLRGPILCSAGYGVHTRQIAKWLFRDVGPKLGLDISTEPLPWGKTHWLLNPDLEDGLVGEVMQAANNKKSFYDVTIQVQLPNEWNPYLGGFNIGVTAGVETDKCNPAWVDNINRMDLVIVPSEFTKQTFLNTGEVKTPIVVIPESYPEVFDALASEDMKPIDLKLKTKFNFLLVGQLTGTNVDNDRKNIPYTIKWMAELFDGQPDVGIVVKTNCGAATELDKRNVQSILSKLISEVSKPTGPTFYLLHGHMTDEEMKGLYTHPDIKALVNLTHGEGFCGLDYTPIVTKTGTKRLDSLLVGDEVLTHLGNWKPVTKQLSRSYSGQMVKIRTHFRGFSDVVLTPNHRVYTHTERNGYAWKPAGELTVEDSVCITAATHPTTANTVDMASIMDTTNIVVKDGRLSYRHSNKLGRSVNQHVLLDRDAGKLFGYFFAEGSVDDKSGITFSLHQKEEETLGRDIIELMDRVFGVSTHTTHHVAETNKLTLKFYSSIVSKFLGAACGVGARNKRLHSALEAAGCQEFIRGFITGTFLGDGYIAKKEISLELGTLAGIQQVRRMLLGNGIVPSFSEQRKTGTVQGTPFDNVYYRIRVSNTESYNRLIAVFNEHCPFKLFPSKVSKRTFSKFSYDQDTGTLRLAIKELGAHHHSGTVYNVSVQDDESYSTEDFVVHNCLPALEAAACDLPVIVTDWSGHLQFLKEGKYIGVDYIMGDIHESRVDNQIFMPGVKWAYPTEVDSKRRLSKFKSSPVMPKAWAVELGKKVREKFSFSAVSKLYTEVLETQLK